ncbi:MAG: hypothetical protein AB1671_16980, partial [Thermodesulfobacteriota bacterium]
LTSLGPGPVSDRTSAGTHREHLMCAPTSYAHPRRRPYSLTRRVRELRHGMRHNARRDAVLRQRA